MIDFFNLATVLVEHHQPCDSAGFRLQEFVFSQYLSKQNKFHFHWLLLTLFGVRLVSGIFNGFRFSSYVGNFRCGSSD